MTVKVHTTEPVPPPKTYDLLGLTQRNVIDLLNLLGEQTGVRAPDIYDVLLRDSGAQFNVTRGHYWPTVK